MTKKGRGWFRHPVEHGLAARGIKTGRKSAAKTVDGKVRYVPWVGKKRDYMLRRYPSPGKFEGGLVIDDYVYQAAGEWGAEYIGDIDVTGFIATPLSGDEPHETGFFEGIERNAEEAGDILTPDEKRFLKNMAGAIVIEDSFGFVNVEYFETKKVFDDEIKWFEKEYENALEEIEEYGEFRAEGAKAPAEMKIFGKQHYFLDPDSASSSKQEADRHAAMLRRDYDMSARVVKHGNMYWVYSK